MYLRVNCAKTQFLTFQDLLDIKVMNQTSHRPEFAIILNNAVEILLSEIGTFQDTQSLGGPIYKAKKFRPFIY